MARAYMLDSLVSSMIHLFVRHIVECSYVHGNYKIEDELFKFIIKVNDAQSTEVSSMITSYFIMELRELKDNGELPELSVFIEKFKKSIEMIAGKDFLDTETEKFLVESYRRLYQKSA